MGSTGEQITQSIIEDLIGMRRGDIIFFHVLDTAEGESSLHGIYRASQEPFYNDTEKLWDSTLGLIYPYRFCFEPHPKHRELCVYDTSVPVSEFYRSIENRDVRSLLTLEREEMGPAHAVKTITTNDAKEIEKLLYRDFSARHLNRAIDFKPATVKMLPLRNFIEGVGRIEFAVKALVAYHLGQGTRQLIELIPACRKGPYDFLIESFVGQTARQPSDILCISDERVQAAVTFLEAKTKRADSDDLVQVIAYQELFRLRNMDKKLDYKTSLCLLAQRFSEGLISYASVRSLVLASEEIVLLRYIPTPDGKDATFARTPLVKPTPFSGTKSRFASKIDVNQLLSKINSNPTDAYRTVGKGMPPRIVVEYESSIGRTHILRKYYLHDEGKSIVGNILIHIVAGECGVRELAELFGLIRREANKFRGDFMAVEPILIAESYDSLADCFVEQYNEYETKAGKQPVSLYQMA